jgi:hypothetical protein
MHWDAHETFGLLKCASEAQESEKNWEALPSLNCELADEYPFVG